MTELRYVLSLIGSALLIIFVLVLTYYASRWYAKKMGAGPGKYIQIIDRAVLGQGSAIYIVKVENKYYMLGSADKGVRMLSELPDFEETPQPGTQQQVIPFKQIMRDVLTKAGLPGNKRDDGEN